MPDNLILDVNGVGAERLATVLGLAYAKTVVGYAIDQDGTRLVLFRSAHSGMIPLPSPTPVAECASLVHGWLVRSAVYDEEPDIDGSVSKGWRASCDAWGHVDPYGWPAFLAIRPDWALHGK